MGDPKSSRQQYEEPSHPWKGERIEEEDEYVRKYGLKNKKEFWKAESMLRDHRAQARQYLPLVLRDDEQGKTEAQQLLDKLHRLGILDDSANLDDVLALGVDSFLSRRLQTLTYLKGLANTPNQARQFIVHGHIAVGGKRVDVPGYLVERDEEPTIDYAPGSPLNDEAHPLNQGSPSGSAPSSSDEVSGPGAGAEDVDADEADDDVDESAEEEEEEADEEEASNADDEEAEEE